MLLASISRKIIDMASERGADKTICPSEVARQLFPADWRKHMDEVRAAAIDLHNAQQVLITQQGKPVNVNDIKGPIRIRIITPV